MICPHCGQETETVKIKPQSNFMYTYVEENGKVNGVYNSNEEKLVIKTKDKPDLHLIRQDKYVAKPAPVVETKK